MKFYRCNKCGNVVEMLDQKDGILSCCGEEMKELIPNSTDASNEKHVPFCQVEDETVLVTVGSQKHPMDENHYIMYVIAEYSDSIIKYEYHPGEEIDIIFDYEPGMKVYAYCNLHGLWMKEID
ncbi:MAG TPA: desulfoferrodoxin Dfx [Firmicutes bacterium]|nr:desulfoferrodoxin Dfx [Bacillota bacterium]